MSVCPQLNYKNGLVMTSDIEEFLIKYATNISFKTPMLINIYYTSENIPHLYVKTEMLQSCQNSKINIG